MFFFRSYFVIYTVFLILLTSCALSQIDAGHTAEVKCPDKNGYFILPRYYPTRNVILGFEDHQERADFIERIADNFNDGNFRFILMVPEHHENLEWNLPSQIEKLFVPSKYTIWTQDYFEMIYSSQKKESIVLDLPYDNEDGNALPPVLAKKLGLKVWEIYSNQESVPSGEYGGNIEAISEDHLLVGNNMSYRTRRYLTKKLDQNLIKVDVSWLETGHVDELYSVIPIYENGEFKRDIAIFYASPKLALNIIKDKNQRANDGAIDVPVLSDDEVRFDFSACYTKRSSWSKKYDLVCDEFRKANLTYQKIIDENLKNIVKKIRNKFRTIHTFPLPVLFQPVRMANEYGIKSDKAISVNPNPVNNVLIGDTLIIPSQPFDFFRKQIDKTLSLLKQKNLYLDGNNLNKFGGGIHCSVFVERRCD